MSFAAKSLRQLNLMKTLPGIGTASMPFFSPADIALAQASILENPSDKPWLVEQTMISRLLNAGPQSPQQLAQLAQTQADPAAFAQSFLSKMMLVDTFSPGVIDTRRFSTAHLSGASSDAFLINVMRDYWRHRPFFECINAHVQRVANEQDAQKPIDVIDAGCGSYALLASCAAAAHPNVRVRAIETVPEFAETARKRLEYLSCDSIQVIQGDAVDPGVQEQISQSGSEKYPFDPKIIVSETLSPLQGTEPWFDIMRSFAARYPEAALLPDQAQILSGWMKVTDKETPSMLELVTLRNRLQIGLPGEHPAFPMKWDHVETYRPRDATDNQVRVLFPPPKTEFDASTIAVGGTRYQFSDPRGPQVCLEPGATQLTAPVALIQTDAAPFLKKCFGAGLPGLADLLDKLQTGDPQIAAALWLGATSPPMKNPSPGWQYENGRMPQTARSLPLTAPPPTPAAQARTLAPAAAI